MLHYFSLVSNEEDMVDEVYETLYPVYFPDDEVLIWICWECDNYFEENPSESIVCLYRSYPRNT